MGENIPAMQLFCSLLLERMKWEIHLALAEASWGGVWCQGLGSASVNSSLQCWSDGGAHVLLLD